MFRYIWAWIQALFGYVKVWLQAATEEDPHDSAWLGAAPAMEEDPVTVSLGPIGPLFQQLRSSIASLQGNSGRLKLKGVKAQIQILGQELEWLCIDVKGLPEAPEDAMTRCWMRQVRDLFYDTADYLDKLMHFIDNSSRTRRRSIRARSFEGNRLLGSKTFLISRKLTWLSLPKVKKLKRAPLIAKLSALVARVEDADETRQRFKLSPPKSIKHDYAQAAGVSHIMPQIPFQLHIDMLTKLLALDDNDMEKNLKVVTIFGSAGVGKTALARTLYHQHRWRFQHRAFIRVCRDPDMRRLLTDMLSQMKAPQPNPFSDVQGLIGSITKHLQGKRYLIIIDDLWTTSTWDIIIRALPDGDYCRIITTTQVEDVALACCSYQLKNIYEITPLNDDQSGKAEGDYTTYTNSEGLKEALNLVYNSLPPRLKTCLLYLNMYPEGCTIRKDELVKQWATEALIASVQGQDIEDTAGYYFDALVSSGLVQSVDTNHNGEVLSCTLHHMVLDLIRQKSMEENFITIMNYFQTILGRPDKVRRLSVQLGGAKGANNIPENMRISQVRSLLFSGFFQHVPSILDYGLLQVLILQIWSDQDRTFDLTTIGELYLLRYMKIEGNMTVKLPGKIRRLRHLGTLQVDATLCVVPSDIVHLEKLLHLCLPSESILPHGVGRMTSLRTLGYFDLGSNSEDNVRSLSELENLHNLQLTCYTVQPAAESLEKNMQLLGSVLLKLSSLRTVTLAPASGSCKGNAPPDYAAVSSMNISWDSFSSVSPAPAHLRRLELSRRCCVFSRLPHWLGELAHLLILKIAVRELWKEDTDILKGLPSLTALSLHVATTSAEMVVFGKGGFSVLTYFKFTCTVPWLKLEAGAMPNIQKLTLAFNSMIEDKQGITIEYLSGIKEISAISKGPSLYSVGAGSAWLKGITNDPRNPKVKWIGSVYVGDECTGHVVTREAQEYYRIQDKGSGGSEIMDETDGVQDEGSGSQPKKYPAEVAGEGGGATLRAPDGMAEAEAAMGSSALMDLAEPLLLLILAFLDDPRSRHSASMACRRMLAAERATRAAMALRGDPRTAEFLLLPTPGFCFPALERLDLSLASPWGHPLLSSASRVAGPPSSSSSGYNLLSPDEIAELNAFVAARLAAYFPAVSDLAVYCRDPSTLANLAPCWRATLRAVKLVRWHQRPLDLPGGADLAPLLAACPALTKLDLSEFYCWTEDILLALDAHPAAAAALTDLDLGLAGESNGFHASELGAIAGACPGLRRLVAPCVFNPRYVDSVGDDALLSLASSCPRLTVLRLSEPFEPASTTQREQAGITAVGLVAFFAALPALEDLMLDLQHNVLEAAPAMEALARRCPRIKVLTLGCFQGLCKAAWLHLDGVAVCGGLQSLCIKNCEDLTDASLGAIGRGCGRLARFAIQGCDLVTAAGVRKLAGARRHTLKEVSVLHCRFLHTAACLSALNPIRDRIESLEINCQWEEVEQPGCAADGTNGCCDHEDDDELSSHESASKKRRCMEEMDNYDSWEMLRSLTLWIAAGQLLSPLISAGLDSCPVLEKISIKVEGDLRTCPFHGSVFGLSDLGAFQALAKMKLDLSEAVGYALTAPTGHMDLSQWERFYLSGIESLLSLYELDYWPPQDKDVNQRSLSLPAVALFQLAIGLRKLFIHGTTHEHFMSFFQKLPNLRDVQLREDYYPAPENDMMITEMQAESCLRFEQQLNNRRFRQIPD